MSSKKKEAIIVLWMRAGDNQTLHSLAYDNGRGLVRVYERDSYDPRLDLGSDAKLPFFRTSREAMAWMLANRDRQCQVALGAARALGFAASELAECVCYA